MAYFPCFRSQPHPSVRYMGLSQSASHITLDEVCFRALLLHLVTLRRTFRMEALGAAASVIAVLSLALQLSQAIESTKDIWKNIKAAPGEVDSVLQDLDLLNGILDGIRRS